MLSKLQETYRIVRRIDRKYARMWSEYPHTRADPALRVLGTFANHSKLWFSLAGIFLARKGISRRAGARGIVAIAATSAITNGIAKPLLPRTRPATRFVQPSSTFPNTPESSSFPSGHAASAAAFNTALTMESPVLGVATAPLAAAVACSRVRSGAHFPSDVLVGALLGAGVSLATRRWWPVRPTLPAQARPSEHVAASPDGAGVVLLANPASGDRSSDPGTELMEVWPLAVRLRPDENRGLEDSLHAALDTEGDHIRAFAVAGGDGTVATAASVAAHRKLPLVVVPAGTLNHFARDLGVSDQNAAVEALAAGTAVHVDLGHVQVEDHPDAWFINTASLGGYPEMVRLREKWEPRWGKWPAAGAALATVLARTEPMRVRMNGHDRKVWVLFVGNSGYQPTGFAPAWRPRLDDGVLDIRYVRADVPLSRVRFLIASLTGALLNSRTYVEEQRDRLRVEVLDKEPQTLACDGELRAEGKTFEFTSRDEALRVYRYADRS